MAPRKLGSVEGWLALGRGCSILGRDMMLDYFLALFLECLEALEWEDLASS